MKKLTAQIKKMLFGTRPAGLVTESYNKTETCPADHKVKTVMPEQYQRYDQWYKSNGQRYYY